MTRIGRRTVLGGLAGASLLSLPACTPYTPRVAIIGGGFAGASAALHLTKIAPHFDVTLFEPNSKYKACPLSNLVITGDRDMEAQTFSYDAFKARGIFVVADKVTNIDTLKRILTTKSGAKAGYDRLILAPGIRFLGSERIEGYDETTASLMPHAWTGGAQTLLLQKKLQAMNDGEPVIIAIPPPPFRCPPGPYERATLIARYLKAHKPRSKVIILDAQDKFSKQALFEAYWDEQFSGYIERIPGSESGQVVRVDMANNAVYTDFDRFKSSVINLIPPQAAGQIAMTANVTGASGWCPINATSFESTLAENIHIIGDATIAAPMPKSAFSANLQGKICAIQVARLLEDKAPLDTTLVNTCYSFIEPDKAISVSGVYHNKDGVFENVPNAGGTSPLGHHPELRAREAEHALQWFDRITREAFGH